MTRYLDENSGKQIVIETNKKFATVESSLSDIPNQSFITNKATKTELQSVASGSPKGTFDTVALLQADINANSTDGKKAIYVVTADGKWYYWNGTAWIGGGVYQSTGIANNSITNEKLSDSLTTILSLQKNLFNGTTIQGNVIETTGELINPTDPARSCTDFIDISSYNEISTNHMTLSGLTSQLLQFYDNAKVFIGTIATNKNYWSRPTGAKYVRQNLTGISLKVDKTLYSIKPTEYNNIDSIKNNIKDINTLLGVTLSDNLFTGTLIRGSVDDSTGELTNSTDIARTCTDFIDINGAKKLYNNWLSIVSIVATTQKFMFFDTNKAFISTVVPSNSYCDVPSGAVYVRQNLSSSNFSVNTNFYFIKTIGKNKLEIIEEIIEETSIELSTMGEYIEIKVHDFYNNTKTDSEIIEDCLSFSSNFKSRKIIFDTKTWNIDRAILLPPNTTVVIDNCTIKQNNGVFDNVFRGNNLTINVANPNGYPTSVSEIENIKILGNGTAQIIGEDINPTMTHPTLGVQSMVGDYYGWRTLQISLSKCTNFEISGITFNQTRCWAISFDKCSYGSVHDLVINSTVKNGDGVDLRSGCHDIDVYNISGSTSDDTVAMTALGSTTVYPNGNYLYSMEPTAFEDANYTNEQLSIYNVNVNNITTVGSHHGIICLCNSGRQVYNILIDGIQEPTASSRESVVKIYAGYGTGYISGDLHAIRVNNVISKGASYAVQTAGGTVADVWFNKVIQEKVSGSISSFYNNNGITVTNS